LDAATESRVKEGFKGFWQLNAKKCHSFNEIPEKLLKYPQDVEFS
jgi:hypothetical protein